MLTNGRSSESDARVRQNARPAVRGPCENGRMARAMRQTDRRDQLLLAALDAIRERGIGNLRVQDVAERAGVSTGTVHYHFSDIEQLIHDVLAQAKTSWMSCSMSR